MNFTPHEFAELYQEIYIDLYRYALYILRNAEDAADAVSDAVLDGFRQRGTLRERERFRQWMFAILANKCKHKCKEYAKRRAFEWTDQAEEGDDSTVDQLADETVPDISRNVWIRELFYKLDVEEREILSLHLFAGYSSQEIGHYLGQPAGTIRSKEHRALEKLRKEMGKS
ncbi:MAG: RNA polymerase sigma factor [Lachnospiraceae bacterium]|nr:RNA polymerase sigma factor [Lachnospiraceae bacterium]